MYPLWEGSRGMIGVPELDSLSLWELIQITWKNMIIEIPEPQPLQLTVNDSIEIQLPFSRMSQQKIITLCKMEIESRLGFMYLADKIDGREV